MVLCQTIQGASEDQKEVQGQQLAIGKMRKTQPKRLRRRYWELGSMQTMTTTNVGCVPPEERLF